MTTNDEKLANLLDKRRRYCGERASFYYAFSSNRKLASICLTSITVGASAVLGGSLGGSALGASVLESFFGTTTGQLVGASLGVVSALAASIQSQAHLTERAAKAQEQKLIYERLVRDIERFEARSPNNRAIQTFVGWLDANIELLEEGRLEELKFTIVDPPEAQDLPSPSSG